MPPCTLLIHAFASPLCFTPLLHPTISNGWPYQNKKSNRTRIIMYSQGRKRYGSFVPSSSSQNKKPSRDDKLERESVTKREN
jgi:hypothetical protein